MLQRIRQGSNILKMFCGTAMMTLWSQSAIAGIGAYVGIGIPHISRFGGTYQFDNYLGLDGYYGSGVLKRPCTDLTFRTSVFSLLYHPFGGSLYLGLGGGKQKLIVYNTYAPSNEDFTIDVDSIIEVGRVGWKWNYQDRGFWWGFDLTAVQSAQSKKTLNPQSIDTSSQDYLDSLADATKVGDRGYRSLGFLVGWSL